MDDDDFYRLPVIPPDPPAYVPQEPDAAEAAALERGDLRGRDHLGQTLPEDQ